MANTYSFHRYFIPRAFIGGFIPHAFIEGPLQLGQLGTVPTSAGGTALSLRESRGWQITGK